VRVLIISEAMCKIMIENERTIKNLLKTYGAGQLMEEAEF